MLEYLQLFREGFGDSSALFIVTCMVVGAVVFGFAGWGVDRSYRAKRQEAAVGSPSAHAAPAPAPAPDHAPLQPQPVAPREDPQVLHRPPPKDHTTERQRPVGPNISSRGTNSSNIIGNNNTVVNNAAPPMLPHIEGLVLTARQVPSPLDDKAPYAIEVTVQAQAEIAPFALGFITREPLVDVHWRMIGTSVFHGVMTGTLNEAPDQSWWLGIDSPGIAPQRPLVITLMSASPNEIIKVVRVH